MPFLSMHEDNSKRYSFRNLKKIINKSDVLFAVKVILNFCRKEKKRKNIFNRFRENITGECTSLFP